MRTYAVLAVVVLVAVGCRSREPAAEATPAPAVPADAAPVRAPEALIAAVAAYKTRVAQPPAPTFGAPDYLEPPTEAELAWITDRAAPLQARLDRAAALHDDSRAAMKAYASVDIEAARRDPSTATDGPIALRWSASVTRQFGRLAAAFLDELLPSLAPTDPSYERRMGGLVKMGEGTAMMLQGSLVTLSARRAELDARRRLAAAWRDHGATFARIWTQAQCDRLRGWIGEVRGAERDAAIREALQGIDAAIARCAPPRRD